MKLPPGFVWTQIFLCGFSHPDSDSNSCGRGLSYPSLLVAFNPSLYYAQMNQNNRIIVSFCCACFSYEFNKVGFDLFVR